MFLSSSPSKALDAGTVLPWERDLAFGSGESLSSPVPTSFTFEERLSYLREFGSHCMSFSTLQPGMEYFDMPGIGFIAYRSKWGVKMVLADPVCDEKDRETLIGAFLSRYKRSTFIQITEPVAELMSRRFGYYATQFGQETVIDLTCWSLSGKKKQVLRTSVNQAVKNGIVIREAVDDPRYKELSDQWITTRKIKKREISFLIRPMEMEYQKETRKFFAYQGEDLIGFVFFDPIYRNGKITGYVPNISRFSHKFRQGIFYPMMIHAMEKFKEEGLEELNLGLSILVLDEGNRLFESGFLKNIERLIYRYGNFIYNFKGIEFTKSRFCGHTNRFYSAHRNYLPAVSLISMFKLANVF